MTDPGRALETIVFERRNGVALITLNRPERLNAISRQLMTEMQGVLDEVEADAALGAVVLHGAGRAFCSGFDLKDDADAARSGVAAWREALQRDLDFMLRFWDFPKPTLAAVHGYCLAGGCELAMSCDITIADESARFGEPELKFGTTIINMIMPWLIGPKLTKELILSGEDRILPARAERIGLINKVVPKGEHLSEAMALAQRIAALDPASVQMTKQAINRSFETMGLREALKAGLDTAVQLEAMETPSRVKFREITREKGLKAAIAWRDGRMKDGQEE
jgi:enoyl-CoA hydratase